MISHRQAIKLAATAVDFPLDASDRGALDAHLGACAACRAEVGAYRQDAAGLAALPPVLPPGWVRGAIGRTHRPRSVMLLAAALFITASAGITLIVGSALREAPVPPIQPSIAPLGTERPLASPSQTVSASASPAALDPSTAQWSRIGTVGASSAGAGAMTDLIGFGGGYVALGSRDPFQEPVASFSKDGRSWGVTSLANLVPNCPGWGPPGNENVPDADAAAIATNGRQVVIVGARQPHDATACADVGVSIQPIAWVSDDGRTWQRSEPFYASGPNGRATAVWAVPGGWQAAAEAPTRGTLSLWQSGDGLHWQLVGDLADVGTTSVNAAAAADGTVLLTRNGGDGGLRTSRDGRTWTPIDKAGGCEKGATQIVAPASPGIDAWIVLGDLEICTSIDLVTWSTEKLPMSVWRIEQTRFGALAVGDTCYGAGKACPDPGPRAYLTVDGVAWSPLPHPKAYYGRVLADGPAGVLLIGTGPGDVGGPSGWLLEP